MCPAGPMVLIRSRSGIGPWRQVQLGGEHLEGKPGDAARLGLGGAPHWSDRGLGCRLPLLAPMNGDNLSSGGFRWENVRSACMTAHSGVEGFAAKGTRGPVSNARG